MEASNVEDHVMNDGMVLDSTEVNGTSGTLDPSTLIFSTQDEEMSSPELSRDIGSAAHQLHFAQPAPSASDGEAPPLSPIKKEASIVPKYSPLPYSTSRTGLVYDVRMRFHVEPIPKDTDMHPEDPRRIYEVYNELCQAGLVDDPSNPELAGDYVLLRIPARPATQREVLACHSQKSWDFVMSLKGND